MKIFVLRHLFLLPLLLNASLVALTFYSMVVVFGTINTLSMLLLCVISGAGYGWALNLRADTPVDTKKPDEHRTIYLDDDQIAEQPRGTSYYAARDDIH